MEKMTSVLGYRLIPSPSYRQILFNRTFQTHCSLVVYFTSYLQYRFGSKSYIISKIQFGSVPYIIFIIVWSKSSISIQKTIIPTSVSIILHYFTLSCIFCTSLHSKLYSEPHFWNVQKIIFFGRKHFNSLRGNVKNKQTVYLKTLSKLRLTSLSPTLFSTNLFLTKIVTFQALNLHSLLSLLLSEGQGYSQKDTESLGWARLSNKSYKIECFYF